MTVLKVMLGVLLAGLVLIVGCAALVGTSVDKAVKDEQSKGDTVTDREVRQLKLGTSLKEVKADLGKPRDTQVSKSEFSRDVTVYYQREGAGFLDDWQLTFENGKLTSKNRY